MEWVSSEELMELAPSEVLLELAPSEVLLEPAPSEVLPSLDEWVGCEYVDGAFVRVALSEEV